MTTAAAPSKAAPGLSGQPLEYTTEVTPEALSRHDFNNRQPARCSCSPGPWLGRPAMNTIFLSAALLSAAARTLTSTRPIKMIFTAILLPNVVSRLLSFIGEDHPARIHVRRESLRSFPAVRGVTHAHPFRPYLVDGQQLLSGTGPGFRTNVHLFWSPGSVYRKSSVVVEVILHDRIPVSSNGHRGAGDLLRRHRGAIRLAAADFPDAFQLFEFVRRVPRFIGKSLQPNVLELDRHWLARVELQRQHAARQPFGFTFIRHIHGLLAVDEML